MDEQGRGARAKVKRGRKKKEWQRKEKEGKHSRNALKKATSWDLHTRRKKKRERERGEKRPSGTGQTDASVLHVRTLSTGRTGREWFESTFWREQPSRSTGHRRCPCSIDRTNAREQVTRAPQHHRHPLCVWNKGGPVQGRPPSGSVHCRPFPLALSRSQGCILVANRTGKAPPGVHVTLTGAHQ